MNTPCQFYPLPTILHSSVWDLTLKFCMLTYQCNFSRMSFQSRTVDLGAISVQYHLFNAHDDKAIHSQVQWTLLILNKRFIIPGSFIGRISRARHLNFSVSCFVSGPIHLFGVIFRQQAGVKNRPLNGIFYITF